jgi:hypothetical protein
MIGRFHRSDNRRRGKGVCICFASAYFSFEKCLQWAEKNDVHRIECGLIDGVSWIHGLG